MDARHPTRRSLHAAATVFVANDVVNCRTIAVGLDGITVLAPYARKSGTFVRLQCCLAPGHWLDADTVLEECARGDGQWLWSLRFVELSEAQHAELDEVLQRSRTLVPPIRRSSPVHAPPSPSAPAHEAPSPSATTHLPPGSSPTHAPPAGSHPTHPAPPRSSPTHAPAAATAERQKRPSGLHLRPNAELDKPKHHESLADLYREALKEVREAEKTHRSVLASDDAVWQARNWARKSS